jgi:hypothetical protein
MAHAILHYDPARRYDFQVKDVEYRRDGEQSWLAMIYQPQGAGPFPALLDIHGGAWNNGDRTNNPAIAEGLAAKGWSRTSRRSTALQVGTSSWPCSRICRMASPVGQRRR